MNDSQLVSGLGFIFAGLVPVIGLAALILHWRDRIAKSQGKTQEQVQVRFSAIVQFWSTLRRCIPGVLIILLGVFFAIDRIREHESDWWAGLLFIPAGWVLVLLLARKSWRRYLELQRLANKGKGEYEYISTEPPSTGPN